MAIKKTAAGTWTVDFRTQECSCEKIQGPHRHRVEKTFDTHKEATEYEKEMVAQVAKKEFVKPSNETVREVAEDFLKAKVDAGTYPRATLISYQNHVVNYIVRDLGHIKARDLSIKAIEETAAKWGREVKPVMVNKVLTSLTAIFDRAKRHGIVNDNPAADAERLKIRTEDEDSVEVSPDKVYLKPEVRKLIEATAPGTFDRVILMILAFCGLRVGEALGLKWPVIDLQGRKIEIKLALADNDKGEQDLLQAPKSKSSSKRIIQNIPVELIHELKT